MLSRLSAEQPDEFNRNLHKTTLLNPVEMLERSLEKIRSGQYEEAAEILHIYKAADTKAYKTYDLDYALALSLYHSGKPEQAASLFRTFINKNSPLKFCALYYLAEASRNSHNFSEAVSFYNALSESPIKLLTIADLALKTAECQLKSGEPSKAFKTLTDAASKRINYSEKQMLLFKAAEAIRNDQDDDRVAGIYLKILKISRSGFYSIQALDALESIDSNMDRAIKESGKNALCFGEAYYYAGKYDKSEEFLRRFITEHPDSRKTSYALYLIGRSRQRSLHPETVKAFEDTVAHDPDDYYGKKARLQIAREYRNDEKFGPALKQYDELIRSSSNRNLKNEAFYSQGLTFEAMKNYEAALQSWRKLYSQNRKGPFVDHSLWKSALLLFKLRDFEKCSSVLGKLLDQFEDSRLKQEAWYLRISAFYHADKKEDALRDCADFLADQPNCLTADLVREKMNRWFDDSIENKPASFVFFNDDKADSLYWKILVSPRQKNVRHEIDTLKKLLTINKSWQPFLEMKVWKPLQLSDDTHSDSQSPREIERLVRKLMLLGDWRNAGVLLNSLRRKGQNYADPDIMLTLMMCRQNAGQYDRSMALAESLQDILPRNVDYRILPVIYRKFLFPDCYRQQTENAALLYGLQPFLIQSIIHAESRFQPETVSAAGARGLMQIIPATAYDLAEQMNLLDFKLDLLFKPDVCISMGAFYFASLLKQFKREEVALAAYNAGPINAARWLLSAESQTREDFILAVDYSETREYIQKTIFNQTQYQEIYR